MKKDYEKYMKKCIALAEKSQGHVSPNPLVGAVILDKDGNFAGSGRHEKYGEAHAEVNAIRNVEMNAARHAGNTAADTNFDFKGATIIVNLEPCSHFGKTPPCADLIIKKGFKRVVTGCSDPNPLVAGRGIKKLEEAGIEVITGVMEDECSKLNEIFFKNQTKKLPFIAIKTAVTLDGKIASKTGSSKWITSKKAREHVQKLRNKYDAILTGSNTVLADNPSMTCRMANKKGRNPIRVVVDSSLKTSPDSKIYNDDGTKVFIAVSKNTDTSLFNKSNVEFIKCSVDKNTEKIDLDELILKLYDKGIRSILVEAGGTLNGALIKTGMVDKLYQFIAPKIAGDNDAKSFAEGFALTDINETVKLRIDTVKKLTPDILVEAYFHTI